MPTRIWPAAMADGVGQPLSSSAQGEEIVKRRGYIPTIGMVAMLQAIIDDPSPGPSVFAEPEATPANQAALSETLRKNYRQHLMTSTMQNMAVGAMCTNLSTRPPPNTHLNNPASAGRNTH